jgi:hypothetical protein
MLCFGWQEPHLSSSRMSGSDRAIAASASGVCPIGTPLPPLPLRTPLVRSPLRSPAGRGEWGRDCDVAGVGAPDRAECSRDSGERGRGTDGRARAGRGGGSAAAGRSWSSEGRTLRIEDAALPGLEDAASVRAGGPALGRGGRSTVRPASASCCWAASRASAGEGGCSGPLGSPPPRSSASTTQHSALRGWRGFRGGEGRYMQARRDEKRTCGGSMHREGLSGRTPAALLCHGRCATRRGAALTPLTRQRGEAAGPLGAPPRLPQAPAPRQPPDCHRRPRRRRSSRPATHAGGCSALEVASLAWLTAFAAARRRAAAASASTQCSGERPESSTPLGSAPGDDSAASQ